MPQASDEDRARYSRRFGDIGCEYAVQELEQRGFVLTQAWEWVPPREPSDEELFWMGFLVNEWDFGWLRRT